MASMHVKSVLVTGSSRGIGLEFIKQFVKLPNPPQHVFATCRSPETAHELQKVADDNPTVQILKLDVDDHGSINDAATLVEQVVGENGLNLLINNAAIADFKNHMELTVEEVEPEYMMKLYRVNTLGPLMVVKSCLPLLRKASAAVSGDDMSVSRAAIMNISSRVGSIDDNKSNTVYSYRCSKAALNMITWNLSLELAPDKILAVILHPGFVRTDMTGPHGLIDASESVEGMMNVMATRTKEHNGYFYDFKGQLIPW